MFKKLFSLTAFMLLVTTLAGCVPTSARVSSADAGTPIVQVIRVQTTPSPAETATLPTPTAAALPATATLPPASPTKLPAINGAAATWKTFNSPSYNYAIAYPSDWTVSVENPGTMGEAMQIERVIFKQPNYGTPNQFSTITIEAAQHGYATTGQCQNPTEVVPGIRGCRRPLPKAQNPAQEVIWFQPPMASANAQPYFYVQLVYDDAQYVATLNQMLTTFKYAGAPVTVTPQGDGTCTYRATFLGDVTIPDNTAVAPGAGFTKTWRLRNDGTCAWGYAGFALHRLVFVGGDQLGTLNSVELPFPELRYGGTVDISVPMVASLNPGTYRSNWRLQVDNGPQVGVGPNGDTPLYAQIVVPGAATPTAMPPAWKTYTSSKHHYVVSYPANWTLDVQTSGPGRDPEYVLLRPAPTGLPIVRLYALKDAPPILGYENCDRNLQFRGVLACSISLPKGQIPATQMLVFQKDDSYYQIAMEYEVQQQLAMFEEIVKSFQFTQ